MKKFILFSFLMLVLVYGLGVLLMPQGVLAAETNKLFDFNLWRGTGDGGTNTCNVGRPCTFCDAIVVLSNAISIIFSFSLVAAVVMIAVGGFFSVIDPASPGLKKKGLDMMKNAGIGILIIVVAYPMISFVLRTLVYTGDSRAVSNLMPWSKITCK